MSLEEQISNLKERVIKQQQQLQHKSKIIQQIQYENNQIKNELSNSCQNNILIGLKQQINGLYSKNDTLQVEIEHKNTRISQLEAKLSKLNDQGQYNKKLDNNLKQIQALMLVNDNNNDTRDDPLRIRILELEEKVKIDQDIIIKLTEEIDIKNKIINSNGLLGQEIEKLNGLINTLRNQKSQISSIIDNQVNETKMYKEKYHTEITKNNEYLESLSTIKSQLSQNQNVIKGLQNKNTKLSQQLNIKANIKTSIKRQSQVSTKDAEINTQPAKIPKKSGNFQSLVPPTDKNMQLLTLENNKKNEEIKELIKRIDTIQSQNNKLIGNIQTIKRDLDSKRQVQKILHKNIEYQKNVIENQKNTINNLQREQTQNLEEYENRVEILNKKLSLYSIPQQKSKVDLECSNDKKERSQKSKSLCRSNGSNEIEQIITEENVTQFPMITLDNTKSQHSKMSSSVQYSNLDQDFKQKTLNSPTGFTSPTITNGLFPARPKVKRLEFEKLQKKFSALTCNDRQQQSQLKRQDNQTKTVSARGLKSNRNISPTELKMNIKNILDSSVLLGGGSQFIQILLEFIRQIQIFSNCAYQDIVSDLQKKKQSQKSAFNTNLMKQITQITQIRNECQQTIEHNNEQHKQKIRQKQQIINQLRVQNLKYQTDKQKMSEKIQKLQSDIQKSKKVQSQKQLASKQNLAKNTQEIDPATEKLKQQKAFLKQKIQKYQQSMKQYDSTKRKLIAENQKLKSQSNYLKNYIVKIENWVHQVQKVKKIKIHTMYKQSDEFMDMLIQQRLITQRRNKQLLIQLKDKEDSLQLLVEQVDLLKQQLKERQNDVFEIGRQIHQINQMRSQSMRQQIQQERDSVIILKQQQSNLRAKLKQKQQMLIHTQRQISRQKGQINNIQKLLNDQKQKNKSHLLSKRQMTQEISTKNSHILLLQKRLTIVSQEQSYQKEKSFNEFQEILNKLFYFRKRQKQLKPKVKVSKSGVFKTATSARLQNQVVSNEILIKQNKQMKEVFRSVTQSIYQTYSVLPLVSNSTVLFQAQTKQQLLNQVKDIRIFAQNYMSLKNQLDSSNRKTQQAYITLLKRLIKNEQKIDQIKFNTLINELKIGHKQQDKLRDNVSLIFSNRQIEDPDKIKKKIQLQT